MLGIYFSDTSICCLYVLAVQYFMLRVTFSIKNCSGHLVCLV